ncbi:MAG: GNAT family N-acetyltransferase [Clostridiales bacterium]|jgi:ribosomal-protein-alanine N-acetyltransferase|nr:GNAT family N-acetyltransferase [Clostridiales bacterium]
MVENYNEVLYQNETMVTERLILRKYRVEDAADILEYASDAQTVEFIIWEGLDTIRAARAAIYDYYWSRPGIWAIEHVESGKMIGGIDIRLNHDDDKVGFGYVLNRAFWGKGYMTEALGAVMALCFEKLRANRFEAQHYAGNEGSGRVMEKCGMRREGCMAQYEKVKGIFRDCVQYGITREQYVSKRA